MHSYAMLADGDRILVAVSGGIDSLVLAWLLSSWQKKTPISYTVEAVHVHPPSVAQALEADMDSISGQLDRFAIPIHFLSSSFKLSPDMPGSDHSAICFRCARSRRNRLFSFARENNFSKIAFGHHRDDIVETFFLNLTSAGNISTMIPRQDLFSGRLSLIRPLAYLQKEEVEAIGARLDLKAVASRCPLGEQTRRSDIHDVLAMIYAKFPGAREHMFAALGNIRHDYLLKPQKGGNRADRS